MHLIQQRLVQLVVQHGSRKCRIQGLLLNREPRLLKNRKMGIFQGFLRFARRRIILDNPLSGIIISKEDIIFSECYFGTFVNSREGGRENVRRKSYLYCY